MKKFLVALLAGLMCLFMVACAPADMEKAKAKMEEAGYSVTVLSEEATEVLVGEEAVGSLNATKTEGGITNLKIYTVNAILFESAAAAKAYYNETKTEEVDEGQAYKVSGCWVISGSEVAVNAFLK